MQPCRQGLCQCRLIVLKQALSCPLLHWSDGALLCCDARWALFMLRLILCTAGDFVGACLNRADKTISYYKNGIDLGVAFHNVQEERLYPCIGMQTHDEEVRPRPLLWRSSCA